MVDGDSPPLPNMNKLAAFLKRIGSASEDYILRYDLKETLYHYTDFDGLKGMVENNDLWLTNAQYCNDDEELTHGLSVVRKVVKREMRRADGKRKQYLKQLSQRLNTPKPQAVYICCFCEEGDLLSQWRAYGANGAGVCLAFEPRKFKWITGPDCSPSFGLMRFWKVFYPEPKKEKIIRSAINFYPDFNPRAKADDWAHWTAAAIQFFLPTFKNSDFNEEKEWRLIFTPAAAGKAKPEYRVGRNMLIPYFSLSGLGKKMGYRNRKLPLSAVRVGPGPNKQLNAESIRMLLKEHGYSRVKVDISATPFRS